MIRGNLQTFLMLWNRVEPTLRKLCTGGNGRGDLSILVEEMPGLVSSMLTGTERVVQIVSQVKRFSRAGDNAPPQCVDLAQCLDEALILTAAGMEGIIVEKRYRSQHSMRLALRRN